MKRMKKIVLLVVAAMMLLWMAGCGPSEEEKIKELVGIWRMTVEDTEEQARILLENIDLYEEEIALADLTSLDYVQLVEFTKENTYRFAYDVEGTRACVREFYQEVFADLYEGRVSLNETYGYEFDDFTEEEFYQFYAEMYEMADYTALIEYITGIAYDYEGLGEAWETGTYSIDGEMISCMIDGQTKEETLGYAIDGYQLTLTYVDGTEVYTR